jgi:DNA invertase Pin-like site-specific DNA recombinase
VSVSGRAFALAKARGGYRGRKKSLSEDLACQLRERARAGEAKATLAREFGISRATVYQYLRTALCSRDCSAR